MTAVVACSTYAEPLFESTHNALRFGFGYSHEQYGEGTLAGLLKRRDGGAGGKGLVGLDGAAQAGMVLAEVWRLPALERHAIVARYGAIERACPCCGGKKMDDEWAVAIEGIAAWAVPAGVSQYRARRDIVARFFLRRGSIKDIAEEYGLDRRKLGEQAAEMEKRVKGLEARAQTSMDDALKGRGMVG